MKKTTLFFWGGYQNHVYELTKAMGRIGYKVYIVQFGEIEIHNERIPKETSELVDLVYCRSYDDIYRIAQLKGKEESLHINSGLKTASGMKNAALKWLLNNKYDVFSLPQESFQLQGIKGFVNQFKWWIYLNCTYRRKIKAFGITGLKAAKQFKMLRVPQSKCFQFIYVTTPVKYEDDENKPKSDKLRLMFVGSIDKRKNIIPFVRFMQNYVCQDFELNIYGSSILDGKLIEQIGKSPNIHFHGRTDYETVRKKMYDVDYIVLPSLHDGWGAVGNEGLQAGCKLLISDECGCAIFPKSNPSLGYAFSPHSDASLKYAIDCIFNEHREENLHARIIKWSEENISPENIGVYLDKIIKSYFEGKERPTAAWCR